MEIRVDRLVAAPPAMVWEILTDLDAAPETIRGIERVERLEGPAFGVGTKWRETRTIMGKEATEDLWITEVRDGERYVAEADSRGTAYRSDFRLTPSRDGTRLELVFTGQPHGLVSRILAATLGRLFAGTTRKMLRADLDDIAATAEARAAS